MVTCPHPIAGLLGNVVLLLEHSGNLDLDVVSLAVPKESHEGAGLVLLLLLLEGKLLGQQSLLSSLLFQTLLLQQKLLLSSFFFQT